MNAFVGHVVEAASVGIIATAFMDLSALARRQLCGTPVADYALVGRWLAHMRHGRFRHAAIAKAPAVRAERALGWAVHYATGIVFAGLLLVLAGPGWLRDPTVLPALAVGIGSVAAPLLLMQPGMGAGIAAWRTPDPTAARVRSLVTHAVFGVGLYLAGSALRLIVA
jgi:hypothetical protein